MALRSIPTILAYAETLRRVSPDAWLFNFTNPAGLVTQALRERIERVRRGKTRRRLADELDEIAVHCSALPVRDTRSDDEIMGYDEHGLPR